MRSIGRRRSVALRRRSSAFLSATSTCAPSDHIRAVHACLHHVAVVGIHGDERLLEFRLQEVRRNGNGGAVGNDAVGDECPDGATGGATLQSTPPATIHVARFVPHQDVLPQAAAVITHAGLGTVHAALAHGLPLVCMPIGRDQPDIAARVEGLEAELQAGVDAEDPQARQPRWPP